MTLTKEEGEDFASQFMAGFCAGFADNNHAETMSGFFAEETSWSWSDGTKGEGSIKELMDIMKQGWGEVVTSYVFPKPLVCVDTVQSRIVIASPCVFSVVGTTDLVMNECIQIFKLDEDKKVTRWSAVWDPNNKQLAAAVAKIQGKELPMPEEKPAPLTVEEGKAFAKDFLEAAAAGFAKNNHAETMTKIFADRLSWDWSDGTKGEGSYEEIMEVCLKNWSSMVSSFHYADPLVAVDTNRSVVTFVTTMYINVSGRLQDENNPVVFTEAYAMHLDNEKKCNKWHMCWDHYDSAFQAAFAKVTMKLEAAAKVSQGVPVKSSAAGMMAGQ